MLERRTYAVSELRIDGETPVITGHAAVFNQKSEEIFGFREIIKPGAFAKTIQSADVRALWNHDANFVLGRTKNGTLELSEDKKGLSVRITPPDTTFARDILASIKRGDVDQMSFGFRTITDEWRKENKEVVRELVEVELFDVSPVTFPAYPQTDVFARSFYEERVKLASVGIPGSAEEKQKQEFLARVKAREEFLEHRPPPPADPLSLPEIIKKSRIIPIGG